LSARERFLIRLPNWLGDVLMARPLLHSLRRARPDSLLIGVGPAHLLGLLAGDRVFDEAHSWPGDAGGRRRLAAALRESRPDVALVLPPSFSSAWFAWRTGARARLGYAHDGRSFLLTAAARRGARGDLHLSREYLELVAPLGVPGFDPPVLASSELGGRRARERLVELGIEGHRFALLAPGARFGPAKRWPVERFAALGRALVALGWRVVACGAEDDLAACDAVAEAIGPQAASLAGRTDLETQGALCAAAAVVVSNDSGLAHLAAASGAPTVVVFGSTSSAWTAPLGPRVRVIQKAPVCSPCFRRTCAIGYRCLTAVDVDRVARACVELVA
jgi:heptosyltransferase-2